MAQNLQVKFIWTVRQSELLILLNDQYFLKLMYLVSRFIDSVIYVDRMVMYIFY